MGSFKNKIGLKFGKLLVVRKATDDEIIKSNNTLYYNDVYGKKRKTIYYWCKCDCGREDKLIVGTALKDKKGGTNSCGCLWREIIASKNPKLTNAKVIYRNNYDDGDLTFDEFCIISQQNCFYCGSAPANNTNIFKRDGSKQSAENGTFTYNGLDRVDSNKKHNSNNVVPCCRVCNFAKYTLGVHQFFEWIDNLCLWRKNRKFLIISHRGNLHGPNIETENHPGQVKKALSLGLDVEIDLRIRDGKFYLGHDIEQYEIDKEFIFQKGLWVHAKDVQTLSYLVRYKCINFFSHNKDDVAITSQFDIHGYIWTFPRADIPLTPHSIAVMPELVPEWDLSNVAGICTDYPYRYAKQNG